MDAPKILRVGILGCGLVAQIVHLPTLALLSDYYKVTSVCDVSPTAAAHCAAKFSVPHHTCSPQETIEHSEVDIVFNLTSDDMHEPLTIAALQAGKWVLLEKPIARSKKSALRILEAEKEAKANSGATVFVGYMRRYAPSFTGAFKRELENLGPIKYARVRDIIGHNDYFVAQSGFELKTFNDYPRAAAIAQEKSIDELVEEAWGGPSTTERLTVTQFMSSLGSHDISLMREALGGLPLRVDFFRRHGNFYNGLMTYRNSDGSEYLVTYESGIDDVPRFDAHIQVYGQNKSVKIEYDTPFVKGLPIVVVVDEQGPHGEMIQRRICESYEDAFTTELRELYACVLKGKAVKTTLEDAIGELIIVEDMYRKSEQST